jgi:hypothetical protein
MRKSRKETLHDPISFGPDVGVAEGKLFYAYPAKGDFGLEHEEPAHWPFDQCVRKIGPLC